MRIILIQYGVLRVSKNESRREMKQYVSFISLSVVMVFATSEAMDNIVEQFAIQYKQAKSEAQRRTLCIKAIDEGIVSRGVPIATIDRLFGTAFARDLPAADQPLEPRVV